MTDKYQKTFSTYSEIGAALVKQHSTEKLCLKNSTAWKTMASHNLTGLLIPQKYNGSGLNLLEAIAATEAVSYHIFDVGILLGLWAQNFNPVVSLLLSGSTKQKETYLPETATGNIVIADAVTEPGSGSDAFAMHSKVTIENKKLFIDGEKQFISNATVATHILLYVKNPTAGNDAYIIENNAGKITCTEIKRNLLSGCSWGSYHFNKVEISNTNRVGKPGTARDLFATTMAVERLGLAACHVALAKRYLHECRLILKQNSYSFTQHQQLFHQIADFDIKTQAAQKLIIDTAVNTTKFNVNSKWATACKYLASNLLFAVCTNLAHVAQLANEENKMAIDKMITDSITAQTYSGTSEILLNLYHIQQ